MLGQEWLTICLTIAHRDLVFLLSWVLNNRAFLSKRSEVTYYSIDHCRE